MERLLLTLLVVAFFALCLLGMWRGWRRQARTQSVEFAPFPEVPAEPGTPVLPAARGVYVCSTRAGHWQQRIVTRGAGVRSTAALRLYPGGIEVLREGAPAFWIPRESVLAATVARGMAGKVMGTDSLLVITWRLAGTDIDTGFRGEDTDSYPQWIDALGADTVEKGTQE
ncbi:PH-like domain-containing protein [Amycolatopsis aidingensis]|uniref:PH-like domain-containing protein n=1 Tax=Amycolatopsis aidingensis TaxID=2842453 RepID=UPI001C0ADE58|nr:transporter [Amycolatopsis aidingensis]